MQSSQVSPPALLERLAALRAVRDLLIVETPRLMDLLTESATYQAARYEVDAAVRTLDGAAAEIARNRPPAVGSLVAFMPSNVLLYSYVMYLLVPSLFTQRLAFRASSQVSGQTTRLHELLAPVHRLPIDQRQVSQQVFLGETVPQADLVVFTGAYQNAERIRPRLRPDQLFLFFGAGINPFVVTRGADLDLAVRDAAAIRLLNSGQDCLAPDAFFIHESRFDAFVDALVREVKGLRFGPYTDPRADYGPIYYEGALEAAAMYLCRHKQQIVHGGSIDFRTRRLEPAVLVSDLASRPEHAEFFAPVFNLIRYSDEEHLSRLITSGSFIERALGASVYGPAPDLVGRLRQRHTVTTDCTLLSIDDGNRPFGGRGPMANHIALGGTLAAKPILISEAVAEYLGNVR